MKLNEISPENLDRNAFKMIGKDWLLITAENNDRQNTMTASWGGIGINWGKPVVYIFIRPQRYTKEFVDAADTFSLSVLPEKFRKELSYLGTVSGRDENKINKAGLTIEHDAATPYFAEADLVFICKKLYAQELKPECFIDKSCDEKWFANKDYHTMYVAEIIKILEK